MGRSQQRGGRPAARGGNGRASARGDRCAAGAGQRYGDERSARAGGSRERRHAARRGARRQSAARVAAAAGRDLCSSPDCLLEPRKPLLDARGRTPARRRHQVGARREPVAARGESRDRAAAPGGDRRRAGCGRRVGGAPSVRSHRADRSAARERGERDERRREVP